MRKFFPAHDAHQNHESRPHQHQDDGQHQGADVGQQACSTERVADLLQRRSVVQLVCTAQVQFPGIRVMAHVLRSRRHFSFLCVSFCLLPFSFISFSTFQNFFPLSDAHALENKFANICIHMYNYADISIHTNRCILTKLLALKNAKI